MSRKIYFAFLTLVVTLPAVFYGAQLVSAHSGGGTSAHGETVDIKVQRIEVTPPGGTMQILLSSPSDGPVTINVGLDDYLYISTRITTTTTDSWTDNINPFAENWPDIGECVDWAVSTAFDGSPNDTFDHATGTKVRNFLSAWDGVVDTQIIANVTCAFGSYSFSDPHKLYDEVTIIVKGKGSPPPPGAPTLTLTANPTSITSGQSTTVSWGSTNTTSCTGSRGGSYPTSGSFVDSPSSTITYGMTCTGPGGSVTKSVTVTVGAVANRAPVGYHDTVNNSTCRTTGWAYDPDSSSTSIAVHIYRDGPTGGGGTILDSFPTNVFRSDVNSTYGVSGNHGFDASLSSYIADGISHPLYVYAIDATGGSNPLLNNSPRTIQCAAAVGPQPGVDIKGQ